MSEKQDQVERYLRAQAKFEKRARNAPGAGAPKQKARGQSRSGSSDWRDWVDDDEPAPVERMRRTRGGAPARTESVSVDAELCTALVVGLSSGRARVRLDGEEGVELEARIEPRLAVQQQQLLSVGDRVRVESGEEGPPKLTGVAARRSVLGRPDPADPRRQLVLAANVDRAAVVLAPREGVVRTGLFERVALALARGGVEPLLVVNKLDLLSDPERALGEVRSRVGAEVPVLGTRAESGAGVEELLAELCGRTAVLVGQSGVGKSTLANALLPGAERATGRVRDGDGKGRHTTTASALLPLPGGGWLIDTPGIRVFGLNDVAPAEVLEVLPRLRELAGRCRFADCRHGAEPGCALVEGAQRDPEVARELERFRRILTDD